MTNIRTGVIFDSRISNKVTKEELKVSYKVTDDELDLLTKLYQAYKIRGITKAPTLELFLKELVFSNIDEFKKRSDYASLYPEMPKV
jgi:hypothetical protein